MDPFTSFEFNSLNREFCLRAVINLIAIIILTRGIYYRNYKRSDMFLTFFGFNIIIFFVSYTLNKVEMTTGAAFGLFAVFSMLRYRTEGISAKDMTYLFLSLAIGLLSSISNGNFAEISLLCFAILLITFLLESNILMKKENSRVILYDNVLLIKENVREELIRDLKLRTELNVHRIRIEDIDYLRDSCRITVFYYE